MAYDTTEAAGILARAHAALSPATNPDRDRAALDLLEAVKEAAEADRSSPCSFWHGTHTISQLVSLSVPPIDLALQ